jgi:hypothetical protein
VALMKSQGKRVPGVLAVAAEEAVRAARLEDAKKAEEVMEGTVHPDSLSESSDQEGKYPHYWDHAGHRYGLMDKDAGVRSLKKDGKTTKTWVGLSGVRVSDSFTSGKLASVVISASKNEHKAFHTALRNTEKALGEMPETMCGDSGIGMTRIYRRCALRGIALVLPFRPTGQKLSAAEFRNELLDEHGPRCAYCGGVGTAVGARLGLIRKQSGALAYYFRCADAHTSECRTARQFINMPTTFPNRHSGDNYLWRMLPVLSPMTQRFQAILGNSLSQEHGHHHARKRYHENGNNETLKIKRFGAGAHRLRNAISRFVEWFRICLRHGWIGNHPKQNTRDVLFRSGEKRLLKMLKERRAQGINLPYGSAAHKLGLASSRAIPKWIKPPKQ